jgi:hypothetical protein
LLGGLPSKEDVASPGEMLTGASSPLFELPILTMVAAFACMRDSKLTCSSPSRCSKILWNSVYLHAALLVWLIFSVMAYISYLAYQPIGSGFVALSWNYKGALCMTIGLVIIHGLVMPMRP